MAPLTARAWRTASTMLPVPASPLVRSIAAPSAMRRNASPRHLQPQTKGAANLCLFVWWQSSAMVSTSLSSMKSTPIACSICDSTKCPMRDLAMTGMVTHALMESIMSGSDMRATPPSRRMSAGMRSSAITATAPASSAMRASAGDVTSMITPPLSILARPALTSQVDSTTAPAAAPPSEVVIVLAMVAGVCGLRSAVARYFSLAGRGGVAWCGGRRVRVAEEGRDGERVRCFGTSVLFSAHLFIL
jgi:hypothetical protein